MPDDQSPYASPSTRSQPDPRNSFTSGRCALSAAVWSIGSAFPVAAVTAILFRFPVPFAGYLSGFEAVYPAMIAVLFYGVAFGGFIPVGVIAAVGGGMIGRMLKGEAVRCRLAIRLWALAVTATACLTLATLDWIIGPW